jgi:hypothetical protein
MGNAVDAVGQWMLVRHGRRLRTWGVYGFTSCRAGHYFLSWLARAIAEKYSGNAGGQNSAPCRVARGKSRPYIHWLFLCAAGFPREGFFGRVETSERMLAGVPLVIGLPGFRPDQFPVAVVGRIGRPASAVRAVAGSASTARRFAGCRCGATDHDGAATVASSLVRLTMERALPAVACPAIRGRSGGASRRIRTRSASSV